MSSNTNTQLISQLTHKQIVSLAYRILKDHSVFKILKFLGKTQPHEFNIVFCTDMQNWIRRQFQYGTNPIEDAIALNKVRMTIESANIKYRAVLGFLINELLEVAYNHDGPLRIDLLVNDIMRTFLHNYRQHTIAKYPECSATVKPQSGCTTHKRIALQYGI